MTFFTVYRHFFPNQEALSSFQKAPTPDSETLNIVLTPNRQSSAAPNIAIVPSSRLPQITSDISRDVGVDVEAVLSAIANSAAVNRNKPMLVEENHTQLIKKLGMPTILKVRETLSEVSGNKAKPEVHILKNSEHEDTFNDLPSLIEQVTGHKKTMALGQFMPKSVNLDDALNLSFALFRLYFLALF